MALRQRVFFESANLAIQPRRGNRVDDLRKLRSFARVRATFSFPFRAAAVEKFDFFVPEKPKDPERIGRPPVGFVAIENYSCVGGNAVTRSQFGKGLRRNIVSLHGVIQIRTPIDVNGIRDVTGPIEENIFVAFHDPNVGIIEVLGEPGGLDQTVGSCVGAHGISKF